MTRCLNACFGFTGPVSLTCLFFHDWAKTELSIGMRWSGLYEWVRKFVTEGVVNHPNLGITFITCFVRPRVTSCQSTCSWINVHHFEKCVSYPMIPNVHRSVTDYANEKCVYVGRCLGPINRPWPVPGLSHCG